MFRSLLQEESPDAGASNISKKIKQPFQFHLENSYNRQKTTSFRIMLQRFGILFQTK